jgi:hypothetical protein
MVVKKEKTSPSCLWSCRHATQQDTKVILRSLYLIKYRLKTQHPGHPFRSASLSLSLGLISVVPNFIHITQLWPSSSTTRGCPTHNKIENSQKVLRPKSITTNTFLLYESIRASPSPCRPCLLKLTKLSQRSISS